MRRMASAQRSCRCQRESAAKPAKGSHGLANRAPLAVQNSNEPNGCGL
jgi:hypothetical protein